MGHLIDLYNNKYRNNGNTTNYTTNYTTNHNYIPPVSSYSQNNIYKSESNNPAFIRMVGNFSTYRANIYTGKNN